MYSKRLFLIYASWIKFHLQVMSGARWSGPVQKQASKYPGTDDRKQLNRAYDDLVRRLESYEGTGSGWVIDYLNSLSITIMPF